MVAMRVLFVILHDSRADLLARALGKHLFIRRRAPPSFIRINIGMNLHGDDNDKYSTHFFYGKSAFRTAAAASRRKRENKERAAWHATEDLRSTPAGPDPTLSLSPEKLFIRQQLPL
jgi:hypothetical protein